MFLFILLFMVVYELFPVSLVCPLPVFCFLFYFVVSVPSVFFLHFLSVIVRTSPHMFHLCPISPAFPVCVYKSLCSPLSLSDRRRYVLSRCRDLLCFVSCASSPVLFVLPHLLSSSPLLCFVCLQCFPLCAFSFFFSVNDFVFI